MRGFEGTNKLDGRDNVTINTKESIFGKTLFVSKVSISGDEMTLTDPDGTVTKLKRL